MSNHRGQGVGCRKGNYVDQSTAEDISQKLVELALSRRLRGWGDPTNENLNAAIKKLVKKAEVCDRYGVSARTVENWMQSGILPFCKPSYGVVRFDLDACDQALKRFERNAAASEN